MVSPCVTVFQSDCHLHAHQQCVRVLIFPHPHQHLSSVFCIIATLEGVKWYLIVVLICISWISNDVTHLPRCLWVIVISSFQWDPLAFFFLCVICSYYLLVIFLFFNYFFKDLERGEGRKRGRETSTCERNINLLPLAHPYLGTWLANQASALTRNWTSDL